MVKRALLLALVGLMGDGHSALAFEDFEPERPFTTTTSEPLEQGLYQLEQGARLQGGAASTLSFPSLHRLGLGSNAELMLESPLVTVTNGQARMADLSIGGKWRFVEGGAWGQVPSMGLVAKALLLESGQILPRLTWALGTELPGALKLETNLGVSWQADATAGLHYSAALAWGLTERFRLCAEVTGERSPGTGQRWGIDGGFGWLLEPSTQVDMLLYKGMTPQAADWTGALGLSKRWGM